MSDVIKSSQGTEKGKILRQLSDKKKWFMENYFKFLAAKSVI